MKASELMFVACVLYMVHRWATNATAISGKIVVEAAVAVLIVAMLDQGETEPVAKGFAWLFVVGAAYAAVGSLGPALGGGPAAAGPAATVKPTGANIPTAPGVVAT